MTSLSFSPSLAFSNWFYGRIEDLYRSHSPPSFLPLATPRRNELLADSAPLRHPSRFLFETKNE